MPRVALVAAFVVLVACAPARAGYDDGLKSFKNGDYAAALRELRPLAEEGNADAEAKLGNMYMQGKGVKQDFTTAMRWLKQAAADGDVAVAECDIGRLYYNGAGVERDYARSARWFQRAADQGYAEAQIGLGTLSEYGLGVPKDYVRAYMLFQLASKAGDQGAPQRRDEVGGVMRPGDIATAERQADSWKPRSTQ